jgi:hypothetical protein
MYQNRRIIDPGGRAMALSEGTGNRLGLRRVEQISTLVL